MPVDSRPGDRSRLTRRVLLQLGALPVLSRASFAAQITNRGCRAESLRRQLDQLPPGTVRVIYSPLQSVLMAECPVFAQQVLQAHISVVQPDRYTLSRTSDGALVHTDSGVYPVPFLTDEFWFRHPGASARDLARFLTHLPPAA